MSTEPAEPHPAAIRLESIQVGLPRDHGFVGAADPLEQPWRSAIVKEPVVGPIQLEREGLAGDGQADRANHGGPDKAVLAYSADHYPAWRVALALPDLPFGGFGENLTIGGLDETSVCIGDLFAIGDVRLQVAQPRLPCWKLARRWRLDELTGLVKASGRTGWYLRVLAGGTIEAGLEVALLKRPFPDWSVARVAQVRHERATRRAEAAELAACELLAESWRKSLATAAANES